MIFFPFILIVSTAHALQLCSNVSSDLLECNFNPSCHYGQIVNVTCKSRVPCQTENNSSDPIHIRQIICRYCYQLPSESDFTCRPPPGDCAQPGVARSYYVAKCRPKSWIICMGRREFLRMRPCKQESGKRYGTTVALSLFLGGLGADRFYLGMWREGLGKLFTFGGLGVWSVVDFVLVVVGYISPPADVSYWNNTLVH